VKEAREKLLSKGFSPETAGTVLEELQESGLLNDEEFARSWAEGRLVSKKLGLRKIRSELAQKGIPREIIDRTEEILLEKYDENENARELLLTKFRGGLSGVPADKLIGVLVRKGYSFSLASKIVKDLVKPDNGD
jgi:regulatory protein